MQVVLASRWFPMLEVPSVPGVAADRMVPADVYEKPDLARSRQVFEAALKDTVDVIAATGTSVIVFSQVPPLGLDQTQCQTLFSWAGETVADDRCFRLGRAEVSARAAYTDDVIRALDERENVMAVIPQDYFCDEESCDLFDPETGEILYRDGDHLSPVGSRYLIDQVNQRQDLVAFIQSAHQAKAAPATQ